MSWQLDGRSLGCCSHFRSRSQSVVDKFDAATKSAILKASSSVVSLKSRIGERSLFMGSGIIIECDAYDGSFFGTILTCATLLKDPADATSLPPGLKIDIYLSDGKLYEGQGLTFDFHYNIATIKIKSSTPLSTAKIRYIDDSISIDSKKSVRADTSLHKDEVASSTRFNLRPGDFVIALGRAFLKPREILDSPALFSCDDSFHDCKELLTTTCTVNRGSVGGPLINCYGEVIGINVAICQCNAFLPMNIAFKCLEQLKNNRKIPRPWLGAFIANLYTANLEKLDELTQKFPHVVKGVIVEQIIKDKKIDANMQRGKVFHWTLFSARNQLKEKVILKNIRKMKRTKRRVRKIEAKQKSLARVASLCVGDVIIKCDQNIIGSHLQLTEALWDKEGKSVELVVVRPKIGQQLNLIVTISTTRKMNRWAVPKN